MNYYLASVTLERIKFMILIKAKNPVEAHKKAEKKYPNRSGYIVEMEITL